MIVVGVDTDSKGSAAVLDTSAATLDVYALPNLTREVNGRNRTSLNYFALAALFFDLTSHADAVWLEQQWARPNQDITTMFAFGVTLGDCRTAVASGFLACGVSIEDLEERIRFSSGREWKGDMRLGDDKKKALAMATHVFPECKEAWRLVSKHTSAAEASLFALYGAMRMGAALEKGVVIRPRAKPYSTIVKSLLQQERKI